MDNLLQSKKIDMNTVLFARVSTREQAEEGYSLPAQEKLLKEYSDKNNFIIKKKFSVPESASGKQERKLFNELLDYLYKNPQIKILVCEKVDRISRNFKDGVKLDEWLTQDENRQIHFVKQSLILHKNSKSNEKFMWDIYLAMARQYSNNLSEETKKGMNEKAEQGWYPGNKKRGYKSVGDIGHKTWFIDNNIQDSKYIAKGFELYDTGNFTLRTLSKELYLQGWKINGKQVSISELHNLLRDPFYCGQFIWHGKMYEGKHTPLITRELFKRVQEKLQRVTKAGKYRKHNFLFGGGILTCGECGRTITAELQKDHKYYHCTKHGKKCTQSKYVREEIVQNQILQVLDQFIIEDQDILNWVRKALKESHKAETNYHSSIMEELEEKRKQLEKRLSNLYDDRVDEKITIEFYSKKEKEYTEQLKSVADAIKNHTKANIDYVKLGSNIFELAQKGREIYETKALPEEKKEFLDFVFLNLKLKDKKIDPTLHNGFDVIAARAKDGNWLPLLDLFINKRTELDYSLEDMKILYSSLNLQAPYHYGQIRETVS